MFPVNSPDNRSANPVRADAAVVPPEGAGATSWRPEEHREFSGASVLLLFKNKQASFVGKYVKKKKEEEVIVS